MMNIKKELKREFPSPEYDWNFINDLVDNYQDKITSNGDLVDNLELVGFIWDCLTAIEHPGTKTVDVDMDNLSYENLVLGNK